jgi:class 3 adenylate cyclase
VGKKKYAYDIWGNAVNIASRMESSGEAGKLNISAATFELVKDKYNCEFRGKIYAKNVGDIDMYFVDSVKTELSEALSETIAIKYSID